MNAVWICSCFFRFSWSTKEFAQLDHFARWMTSVRNNKIQHIKLSHLSPTETNETKPAPFQMAKKLNFWPWESVKNTNSRLGSWNLLMQCVAPYWIPIEYSEYCKFSHQLFDKKPRNRGTLSIPSIGREAVQHWSHIFVRSFVAPTASLLSWAFSLIIFLDISWLFLAKLVVLVWIYIYIDANQTVCFNTIRSDYTQSLFWRKTRQRGNKTSRLLTVSKTERTKLATMPWMCSLALGNAPRMTCHFKWCQQKRHPSHIGVQCSISVKFFHFTSWRANQREYVPFFLYF